MTHNHMHTKTKPTLSLIVAMTEKNWVMGRNNALPWHYPEDLKFFKAKTLGSPILMGRKTYESIGRPLPGRANIVISRQTAPAPIPNVYWCQSLEEGITLANTKALESQKKEVFVIGGAQIFKDCLHRVERFYITWIRQNYDGDVHFPPFDLSHLKLLESIETPDLKFCTYSR